MKKLLAKIRPGIYIKYLFFDHIARRDVNLYKDKLGRHYMANSKFSLFRVYNEED